MLTPEQLQEQTFFPYFPSFLRHDPNLGAAVTNKSEADTKKKKKKVILIPKNQPLIQQQLSQAMSSGIFDALNKKPIKLNTIQSDDEDGQKEEEEEEEVNEDNEQSADEYEEPKRNPTPPPAKKKEVENKSKPHTSTHLHKKKKGKPVAINFDEIESEDMDEDEELQVKPKLKSNAPVKEVPKKKEESQEEEEDECLELSISDDEAEEEEKPKPKQPQEKAPAAKSTGRPEQIQPPSKTNNKQQLEKSIEIIGLDVDDEDEEKTVKSKQQPVAIPKKQEDAMISKFSAKKNKDKPTSPPKEVEKEESAEEQVGMNLDDVNMGLDDLLSQASGHIVKENSKRKSEQEVTQQSKSSKAVPPSNGTNKQPESNGKSGSKSSDGTKSSKKRDREEQPDSAKPDVRKNKPDNNQSRSKKAKSEPKDKPKKKLSKTEVTNKVGPALNGMCQNRSIDEINGRVEDLSIWGMIKNIPTDEGKENALKDMFHGYGAWIAYYMSPALKAQLFGGSPYEVYDTSLNEEGFPNKSFMQTAKVVYVVNASRSDSTLMHKTKMSSPDGDSMRME